MGSETSSERPSEARSPSPVLLQFLRNLGVALSASGHSTDRVVEEMTRLAEAYGLQDVRFFALPTGFFVGVGGDSAPSGMVDFGSVDRLTLRLDQIDEVQQLLARAMAEHIPPGQGITELRRILRSPSRFAPPVTILGHVVLTLGLALVLRSSADALIGCALLGALVGILQLAADRFQALRAGLPVLAAMTVSAIGFGWREALAGGYPAQLVIPPLVTYLPGAALTLGTVELATGSMVAGASRLVYGMNTLFLLVFGVVVGVQIIGLPAPLGHPPDQLGWWAPWVGVLVFGLGQYLFSPAPRRSLRWLLAVLYVTWIVQYISGQLISGQFSAFVGGVSLVPLSSIVERFRRAPAAQVLYLPAFWLLVPGALGLTGLAEFVGVSQNAGLANLASTLLTVISIALGVLVGSSISGAATTKDVLDVLEATGAKARRRLREQREP